MTLKLADDAEGADDTDGADETGVAMLQDIGTLPRQDGNRTADDNDKENGYLSRHDDLLKLRAYDSKVLKPLDFRVYWSNAGKVSIPERLAETTQYPL
jgi:hypothetical protein